MALASGVQLGPYAVLSPLGEGGMGEVWLARDTRLDRTVAIKCVKDALGTDPDRRARVEREAQIVAQLSHPHICTLHDIVQDDGQTYLVMEALAGETLATRLLRSGGKGLPIAQCLTIAAEAAEGLAFAHQHGVVHQDVKPANIMLTPTGTKLLDFGVARLRRAGGEPGVTVTASADDDLTHAGTLPYMAPEQLDGHAEGRSDIFALGAVLMRCSPALARSGLDGRRGDCANRRARAAADRDVDRAAGAGAGRAQVPGEGSTRALAIGRGPGRRTPLDLERSGWLSITRNRIRGWRRAQDMLESASASPPLRSSASLAG